MKDVYFDTSTLITEMFGPVTNTTYNTNNSNFEPWISPVTRHELFHTLAEKRYENHDTDIEYGRARRLMEEFLMKTRLIDVSSIRVQREFEGILNIIHESLEDIPEKYRDSIPGSADLMHFAYAEVKECDIFVTCDKGFTFMDSVDYDSDIDKIIILDPHDHRKIDEVNL